MKNIEIEYKAIISKESYDKLVGLLETKPHDFFVQVNHYYDTKDRKLKSKRVNLRIRHLVNKDLFITTVKEPRIKKEGRVETECQIKNNSPKFLPSEITSVLVKYEVNKEDLFEIGSLRTERYEYKIDDMVLCLDKNTYLDTEDYEIECESSSMVKSKNFVKKLLESNNIQYVKSLKGKQARALSNIE